MKIIINQYLIKDFLWALGITILLLLSGSPVLSLGYFAIVSLAIFYFLINNKGTDKWKGRILVIGRVLSLQNITALILGTLLLYKNLPSLFLINNMLYLLMMAISYYFFTKYSLELKQKK